MTNPNNAVGTNAAYNGRTSVNARNDDLAGLLSAGILSGWAISPSEGMTLNVGGDSAVRDVAVVEDPAGNRTTVNNISGAPISVTIPGAPTAGSRIDAIVAYVTNPPQGQSDEIDNPGACGLIVVSGTAASTPAVPSSSEIRSAITEDGASGSTVYFVVLGTVTVASGTTAITEDAISNGAPTGPTLADGSVTSDKVDFQSLNPVVLYSTDLNTSAGVSQSFNWSDLAEDIDKFRFLVINFISPQSGYGIDNIQDNFIRVAGLKSGRKTTLHNFANANSGYSDQYEWARFTTTSTGFTLDRCGLVRTGASQGPNNPQTYTQQPLRLKAIYGIY